MKIELSVDRFYCNYTKCIHNIKNSCGLEKTTWDAMEYSYEPTDDTPLYAAKCLEKKEDEK